MAEKPFIADVEFDANGAGLNKAMAHIEQQIRNIGKMIADAGTAANKGASGFDQKITETVRALQQGVGQLNTLQKTITNQQRATVNNVLDENAFAKRTVAASRYAKTLKNAETAEDALQARMNATDRQNAARGANNELLSRRQERATELARRNFEEFKRMDAEFQRLEARSRRTSGDFSTDTRAASAARSRLERAVISSSPLRTNFSAEFAGYQTSIDQFAARLTNVRTETAQALQAARQLNALEVSRLTTTMQLDSARKASIAQLHAARVSLEGAGTKEKATLLEIIETEKQRLAIIRQQRAEILRSEREQNPSTKSGLFGSAGATGVLARTAGYAAAGTAIYGVVGALQQGTVAAIEFEEGLAKLGAISGATSTQVEGLKDVILDVAKSSRFSAQELTEAATLLAQAGYSAEGIQSSLKAANDLAIASGSSIAESVDIMTASMGAFQLAEQDATLVSNGLVAALNNTRLSLPQVALAIQYAGVTAHEQNISFQELVASMGAMAQAGVRSGSTMGTGFRQLLTDLQSPTKKLSETLTRLGLSFADVDVQTIGIEQVLRNLSAAGFSSAEAYGSMEKRGAAAYLALQSQLPILEQTKVAMNNQTAAAEAAAKAGDNLGAAWQRAKNRAFAGWEKATEPVLKAFQVLLAMDEKYTARLQEMGGKYRSSVVGMGQTFVESLSPITSVLGLTFDALNKSVDENSSVLEANTTAAAQAKETYAGSVSSLNSLDEAIVSVTKRSSSLKDGSAALNTETLSLMGRFKEFAAAVDVTAEHSLANLITALKTARGEIQQTLAAQAMMAGDASRTVAQTQSNEVDNIGAKVTSNPQFRRMTPTQQAQIWEWYHNPNARTPMATAQISSMSVPERGDSPAAAQLRRDIGAMTAAQNKSTQAFESATSMYQSAADATRAQSAEMKGWQDSLIALSKPGTSEATKNGLITSMLAARNRELTDTSPAAQSRARVLQTFIERAQSTLNSTGHFAEPKASRAERTEPRPLVTNSAIISAVKDEFPFLRASGGGGGTRTLAQHRSIYSRIGKPPPEGSLHLGTNGIAQDFGLPKGARLTEDQLILADGTVITKAQFSEALTRQGMRPDEVLFRHAGTGPHIHAGYRKNRRTSTPTERAARVDVSNEKMGLDNASRELTTQVKNLSDFTSNEMFAAGVEKAKGSFEAWRKQLTDYTNSDILSKNMLPNEAKVRITEMQDQIRQKQEELQSKIADAIVGNLERQLKAIDEAAERSLAPLRNRLATSQGQLEGLDRYGVAKNVPDYVRVLAQKRVSEDNEALIKAQLPAKAGQLASKESALGQAQLALNAQGLTPEQLAVANERVLSLTNSVITLREEYANMQAQAGAPSQIVTTLSGNVTQALQAWRELHVSGKNYAQLLGEEVGPAVDALQGNFATFFDDIFSGARSVGQAFGDMAKSIIRYIQQIVAKLLATKLIELLTSLALNFIGRSPASSANQIQVNTGGNIFGSFNGGPARIHGRANGGLVTDGYTGRDSALHNLAKGEYVMRSASVRSVGEDFMRDLNNNGARALQNQGKVPVIAAPAKQEMAVYVVAPEERPSLTPNDVIVTMQQDLMKGGMTKKLIKHIAQGG
jgi:TP901 family phage tail tape measure protein